MDLPDDNAQIVDLVLHFLYKLDYEDTIAITTFQDEEATQASAEMVDAAEPTTGHQPTMGPDNAASARDIQRETNELCTWNGISLSSDEVCIHVLFALKSLDSAR